ncbi:MAG: hypothetical protein ACKOZX_08575 [Gammaproteobacteria bacterium]
MTVRLALSIAVLPLSSACASDPRNANQMALDEALRFDERSSARLAEAQAAITAMSDDQIRARLTEALADVTVIVKQRGHGI